MIAPNHPAGFTRTQLPASESPAWFLPLYTKYALQTSLTISIKGKASTPENLLVVVVGGGNLAFDFFR